MKKILSIFLAVVMMLTVCPIMSFAKENTNGVLDCGICGVDGDNVTWTLYKNGELVIDGKGDMLNYSYSAEAPWSGYKASIINVTVKNGVTSIGDYAFSSYMSSVHYCFSSIEIPYGVTSIGKRAFYYNENLLSVSIPDTVTYIGGEAFALCVDLSQINIPHGVTFIGSGAFSSCYELKNSIIPGTVTETGNGIFNKYSKLERIVFADGIQMIGSSFFDGCGTLEVVVIPTSVTQIKENAFNGCFGITIVYYRGTQEQWNNISFGNGNGYLLSAENVVFNAVCHDYEQTETLPTCTACGFTTYVCKICGESYIDDYTEKLEHSYSPRKGNDPTCTEGGFVEYCCDICETDKYSEIIPATGHIEEVIPAIPATCTLCGLTEGKKCTVCDEILVAQEAIPELKHTPGEWEVVTSAQVGIEGTEQQKCTVCGTVLDERTIPALPEITYIIGDITGDGKVNAIDARIILRISAQLESTDNYNLPLAVFDLTGDGKVNALDARKALRIGAQLE